MGVHVYLSTDMAVVCVDMSTRTGVVGPDFMKLLKTPNPVSWECADGSRGISRTLHRICFPRMIPGLEAMQDEIFLDKYRDCGSMGGGGTESFAKFLGPGEEDDALPDLPSHVPEDDIPMDTPQSADPELYVSATEQQFGDYISSIVVLDNCERFWYLYAKQDRVDMKVDRIAMMHMHLKLVESFEKRFARELEVWVRNKHPVFVFIHQERQALELYVAKEATKEAHNLQCEKEHLARLTKLHRLMESTAYKTFDKMDVQALSIKDSATLEQHQRYMAIYSVWIEHNNNLNLQLRKESIQHVDQYMAELRDMGDMHSALGKADLCPQDLKIQAINHEAQRLHFQSERVKIHQNFAQRGVVIANSKRNLAAHMAANKKFVEVVRPLKKKKLV